MSASASAADAGGRRTHCTLTIRRGRALAMLLARWGGRGRSGSERRSGRGGRRRSTDYFYVFLPREKGEGRRLRRRKHAGFCMEARRSVETCYNEYFSCIKFDGAFDRPTEFCFGLPGSQPKRRRPRLLQGAPRIPVIVTDLVATLTAIYARRPALFLRACPLRLVGLFLARRWGGGARCRSRVWPNQSVTRSTAGR